MTGVPKRTVCGSPGQTPASTQTTTKDAQVSPKLPLLTAATGHTTQAQVTRCSGHRKNVLRTPYADKHSFPQSTSHEEGHGAALSSLWLASLGACSSSTSVPGNGPVPSTCTCERARTNRPASWRGGRRPRKAKDSPLSKAGQSQSQSQQGSSGDQASDSRGLPEASGICPPSSGCSLYGSFRQHRRLVPPVLAWAPQAFRSGRRHKPSSWRDSHQARRGSWDQQERDWLHFGLGLAMLWFICALFLLQASLSPFERKARYKY